MTTRYVWHKSNLTLADTTNAIRWEVYGENFDGWKVDAMTPYYLPKIEYVPCDPPAIWDDVTNMLIIKSRQVSDVTPNLIEYALYDGEKCIAQTTCAGDNGYRFSLSPFRIEKRRT